MTKITKQYLKELTYEIIGAAIDVHKEIGPGLMENVYEKCLVYELELRGIKVKQQQCVPIKYKGKVLDADLRYDLLVEDCIVVELKAVAKMIPLIRSTSNDLCSVIRSSSVNTHKFYL